MERRLFEIQTDESSARYSCDGTASRRFRDLDMPKVLDTHRRDDVLVDIGMGRRIVLSSESALGSRHVLAAIVEDHQGAGPKTRP